MKHVRLKTILLSCTILVSVMAVTFIVFYPSASVQAPKNQQAASEPDIAGTPVATNQVAIQNYTFTPSVISVKKGTTVIWTNNDTVLHSVVFNNRRFPGSDMLNEGSSFSFAFDTVGEYSYHGGVYPSAVGKVIVTE